MPQRRITCPGCGKAVTSKRERCPSCNELLVQQREEATGEGAEVDEQVKRDAQQSGSVIPLLGVVGIVGGIEGATVPQHLLRALSGFVNLWDDPTPRIVFSGVALVALIVGWVMTTSVSPGRQAAGWSLFTLALCFLLPTFGLFTFALAVGTWPGGR